MATTNLGKVSVTPKGEYDPLITYERLDIVNHNGSSYIVKQTSAGVTPIEGEFYALIAEKGDGGSFVKKAYKTYAAMDADKVNIPANSSVDVTNDLDESKNGAYIYDGSAFTRSQYDSKVVTDKIISDANQSVQNAIRDVVIDANLVTDALTTIVPVTNNATARTQLDKNRENISILDFFTLSELAGYNANKEFNCTRPVQEFFTYITDNNVGTAYVGGRYIVTSGILFGGSKDGKTKKIVGNLHLETPFDVPIPTLLTIQVRELNWTGDLRISGKGGIYENRRNLSTGLVLGGRYAATHCHFNSITVDGGCKYVGLYISDLTTGTKIDNIRVTRCGSGQDATGYSLTSTYSNRIDNTSAGNSQSSTFTVGTLPPDDLDTPLLVCLARGEIYLVTAVNREAKTITIYGMATSTLLEGNLRYVYGAGVYIVGGDASVVNIGKINGSNCSAVFWSAALYPPLVAGITAQGNMAAFMVGSSTTSASVGGVIEAMYCESNEFDFVRITRAALNLKILNDYAFNYSKVAMPSALRNVNNDGKYSGSSLNGVEISGRTYEAGATTQVIYNDPISLTSKSSIYARRGNTMTFTLASPSVVMHELFGYFHKTFIQYGEGSDRVPTKTTFVAPTGYTVNGLDSIEFTGFKSAAVYEVCLNMADKNIAVACVSEREPIGNLTKTIAYSSGDIAVGTQNSTGIALSGAMVGDAVILSVNKPLLGTRIWAEVTSDNNATIYHRNDTADPFSLTNSTLKAVVIR